jgi:hypothetical protein
MSLMLDNAVLTEKIAKKEQARRERKQRHDELKTMVADHALEFTYIRNFDEDSEQPYQFGGAVVCWQMPEKPYARMLEVSIAWCHDNERFDKIEGRFRAAQYFVNGHTVLFKLLPGQECISEKLKAVFENGFVV